MRPIFDGMKGVSGAYGVVLAGAACVTIVLEGSAFLQEDRLVIHQALLVFFLLIPLLTALGLWILDRAGTPGTPVRRWRWPLRWAGVKVDTRATGGTLRVLRRAGFAAVADFVMSFPTMSMGRLRARGHTRN